MIFPAIDLMNGQCVRLYQGDFAQKTSYAADPVEVARSYADAGAEWVHIVDLDGAKNGQAEQSELILRIANEVDIKVQTGGGLRDLMQVRRLIDGGVSRVVLGSLAVTNPQMVKFWLSELGTDKIVLALDVKLDEQGTPFPTTKGWTETGAKNLWELLDEYSSSGLKTILVTDIGRDGVEGGGNDGLYRSIQAQYPTLQLITSGGVGTLAHVKSLKSLKPHGVIIGKALYENRFTVAEAIAC